MRDLADRAKATAALPLEYFASPFSTIGSNLNSSPNGQPTTIWQLNDNLTWVKGKHEFKFGANLRRLLITGFLGTVIPSESLCSLPEFTFGATCFTFQEFFNSGTTEDRLKEVNLDLYAMDTFKMTPKLTVTLGVRAAWNSDPVSGNKLFSRFNGSFAVIPHDVNRPPNLDILPNQSYLFASTPLLQWQPRAAVAYEFVRNTVFRAGFGLFGHPIALTKSSTPQFNPPSLTLAEGGLFGPAGGTAIAPGVPNSAVDAAVAANQKFLSSFSSGALSCASPMASSNCVPMLSFGALDPGQGGRNKYPYVLQWSAGFEHQFGSNFNLAINYVGTAARQVPYYAAPNMFQTVCLGCFAPLPFNTAPDPRFGSVTDQVPSVNSSYNGLQVTAKKRMSYGLSFQANYTYSHCLDFTNNLNENLFNISSVEGFASLPGHLKQFYGNCDYDVRHTANGSYLYALPFHSLRGWLDHVIGGWEVSGTVTLRGGLPITVISSSFGGQFQNGFPLLNGNLVSGQNPYTRTNLPGVTQPGTIQFLNPNAFQSVIDPSTNTCFPANSPQNCQNGNLGRNVQRGPDFRWADLSIGKTFKLTERVRFKFDAQFFNVFNHPNFAPPNGGSPVAGIPGEASTLVGFGTINSTVSPTTGLLGSGLGGDSSVRMIALRGRVEF